MLEMKAKSTDLKTIKRCSQVIKPECAADGYGLCGIPRPKQPVWIRAQVFQKTGINK